jgi:hypothetical protein
LIDETLQGFDHFRDHPFIVDIFAHGRYLRQEHEKRAGQPPFKVLVGKILEAALFVIEVVCLEGEAQARIEPRIPLIWAGSV